jgi:N-acetylglutamate synthase-like GNAT family acetyltransferase
VIRCCNDRDIEQVLSIINDGAQAYKGVIPADRWTEPYMSAKALKHEINEGVIFWCFEEASTLLGVMGLQEVQDVTLVRHAYVRTNHQQKGIGARLLSHLQEITNKPVLIGTWADAIWAIRFYERHGFQMVNAQERNRLLGRYWTVPERQVETSVVLVDANWRARLLSEQVGR